MATHLDDQASDINPETAEDFMRSPFRSIRAPKAYSLFPATRMRRLRRTGAPMATIGLQVTREDVVRRYLDYLDACNRRAWGDLPGFLAETVLVNGRARSRPEYVTDVVTTTNSFPDYRWELLRSVWEGEWLAVHLHDSGTRLHAFRGAPGNGTRVQTAEFDMYRIVDGVIHEVEGTADNARLCS